MEMPPLATQEEMREARIPLRFRDQCASLLIPLNKCRVQEFYLPWKCVDERHSYERCEYYLFLQRVKKMEAIRDAQQGLPARASAP